MPATSTKIAFRRARHRLEHDAAAPGAKLCRTPVELHRRQVAGVELVDQQREQVFLLDRPLRSVGVGHAERHRDALDAELAGAQERAVQLHPFRRDPALVARDAQLGVGAVIVDEAREQQRQHRLPARIGLLLDRLVEHDLVGEDEALRQVEQRLPDAHRELRAGVDVLDVLLGELAAVGAERGIEELDRARAPEIDRRARLAHRLERAHHVLLAPDHVERRQLAQPGRRGFRRHQRIGDFLARGCEETEHSEPVASALRAARGMRVRACAAARRRGNWHDVYSPIPLAAQNPVASITIDVNPLVCSVQHP